MSRVYTTDQPLATGSSWLSFYHVPAAATNLTRITVDGSANATDYLRVKINPRSAAVLAWERVPFTN